MRRTPEPELMDDPEQVDAYAGADFDAAHRMFVETFRRVFPGFDGIGRVLDLGCGPGDITRRFLHAFPGCRAHALDGAPNMLQAARRALHDAGVHGRVELILGALPQAVLPKRAYEVVISNSLLHHLHEPGVLWDAVCRHGRPGGAVFVMDLRRPPTRAAARTLTRTYARGEPRVLQHDFYRSLCAAFEPHEVRAQLAAAGMERSLSVETLGDRHLVVHGRLPA